MSEEEIIETLTNYNLVNHFNNTKFFEALKCLLNMYNQEKEKNKDLEYENWIMRTVNRQYISKDKIRTKIEELEGQEDWYIENKCLDDLYGRIDELKELLEE